jgi:hypothetical protein
MTQKKVLIKDVAEELSEPIGLYIGMVSFESRCTSILLGLPQPPQHSLFFVGAVAGATTEQSLEKLIRSAGENHSVVKLDLDSPVSTGNAISRAITLRLLEIGSGCIFVDTTTFTHEQLLILLRIFHQIRPQKKVFFGYVGAESYSTNTDSDHVWLSRGVSQVRSVLGYPGKLVPSKKLHLIVLVGFEHERAEAVIERFEPARLTLGIGEFGQSVSATHHATNQRFFDEVKNFVDQTQLTQTSVTTFAFSCIDPFKARDNILALVSESQDYNVVVCPMNTKISTVGAGLAALQNKDIQIAYARAIQYNEVGYSTPSDHATIFEIQFDPSNIAISD